ncbi:type II toxin-antitoxin system RelE/ParE family toxin [Treponema vincentii]|uniref:type II toxin-antitoxin system RelE family toxin n=1 Tax=Treponema vincentii TaxID=69710 RepID=UPI001BAECEFC|nr:type II toxin-antitoxin system RelE/ParE family toxin [Treponema vincentii]QUY18354.1 type II toxin-antitoxin system RelE/ParE family toxin [Treponema vincentii]
MVRVQWSRKAVKQMQKIAESDRQTIYVKAKELRNFPNIGNIKHLKNHKYEYRLRIGNYRILFNFDDGVKIISIEEVKKRDERTY